MPPGAGGALGAMGVCSFFASAICDSSSRPKMASVRPKFEGAPLLSACSPAFSVSIQPFPTKQGGNPVRLKNKIAVITGGGQAHDRAEVRLHRKHRVGRR